MPYIRKHTHSHGWHKTLRSIKTGLLVALFSFLLGLLSMAALEMANTPGTRPSDPVENIMEKYKSKYGDNWKTRLKEDYKAYKNF